MKNMNLIATFIALQILFSCLSLSHAAMYLPLPDGSSLLMKEGESAKEAWARGQQQFPDAFKIKVIPNSKKYDADYFNQCKMKAAKATTTDYALLTALQSCEYKATPKKCREFTIEKDRFGNEKGEKLVACVEECTNANPYSKSLGECSKG
jgi:hypothetical protein